MLYLLRNFANDILLYTSPPVREDHAGQAGLWLGAEGKSYELAFPVAAAEHLFGPTAIAEPGEYKTLTVEVQ